MTLVYKDLLSEFRSRETISSMLVFSMLVVAIFNFAFDPGSAYAQQAAPGILWVAFTFSGIIGLNRSFVHEVDKGCLHGLLLAPFEHGAIFFGKMLGNLIFISIVELLTLPLFAVFFNLQTLQGLPQLLVVILLTTLGFSAVGTLFSAISVNTKTREMMLPILFLPVVIPILLAAVNATAMIFDGKGWNDISDWLRLLTAFDLIFISLAYLTFGFVVEE